MTRMKDRGRVRSVKKRRNKAGGNLPARMLIVTEGEVTEKEYFECLRDELGLGRRQVVVISSGGETSPVQVVEHARARLAKKDDNFKYVYCVFDMDGNKDRFRNGIAAVEEMKKCKGNFKEIEAITSVPCFEFWLWLHVTNRIRPYPITGSPCRMLKSDIEEYNIFKNYSKNGCHVRPIFSSLDDKRIAALSQARSLLENAEGEEIYLKNPSTRVYVVVEDMERLSSRKKKAKKLEIRSTR